MRFEVIQRHRAVGYPDALMLEVHHPGRTLAGGFLGTRAGEERSMEDRQLHLPGVVGNGEREEARVLVVHVDEIDAAIRSEGREPQSFPVKQVFGYCEGDPWTDGRERRVGHDVTPQPFHKGDARILATAATISSQLVISLWLKSNPEPLDTRRVTRLIEPHADDADARVIAMRDKPGKRYR